MHRILSLTIFCLLVVAPQIMALDTDGLVGAWLFYDGAMEFGGADMVTVDDDDRLDLTTFTISGWIKSPATSGKWHIIASKELRNPTGRNYGIFGHVNNGTVHYSFTSGGWKSFDAPTNVTDGSQHHVAATYEKPDFKLYVDGKLDAQASPNADPETHNNPLYIGGCDIGDYWMKGSIDEVVLYSRALDENEINELMDKGITDALDVKPGGKLVTTWSQIKSNATRQVLLQNVST